MSAIYTVCSSLPLIYLRTVALQLQTPWAEIGNKAALIRDLEAIPVDRLPVFLRDRVNEQLSRPESLKWREWSVPITTLEPLHPVLSLIFDNLVAMAPLACITLSKSIYEYIIPSLYQQFIASEKALAPAGGDQAIWDRSLEAFAHVKRLVFTDYLSWNELGRVHRDQAWRPLSRYGRSCVLLPNCTSIHIHTLALGFQPQDPLVSPIVRTRFTPGHELGRFRTFQKAISKYIPELVDSRRVSYHLVFHLSHRWPVSHHAIVGDLYKGRPATVTLVCGPEACTSFAVVTSLEQFPSSWDRGKEKHFVWDTRAVSKASEGVAEGAAGTEAGMAWEQATGAVESALLSLARKRATEGPNDFLTAHFYHVVDAKARKRMLFDWIDQNGMGYTLGVQSDLREYVEGSIVELSDEYAEEVGLL
ncbi:hypothetical protein IAT38_007000 [Cryptococcus sp. DSM 104549]